MQCLARDVRQLLSSDRGSSSKAELSNPARTAAAWLRGRLEAATKLAQLNLRDHQTPCAVATSHLACRNVQRDCRQHSGCEAVLSVGLGL